jgi:hypothetical protein
MPLSRGRPCVSTGRRRDTAATGFYVIFRLLALVFLLLSS